MAVTAREAIDPAVGDEELRGWRLPLALRIFLLVAFLMALAVGASVAVTRVVGERIARGAVAEALDESVAGQQSLTQQRLSLLESKIQLMAQDPDLVNYVAAAFGDDLGLGASSAPDSASIRDLLAERRDSVRFDLGLVLDPQGMLVARSDESEAYRVSFADDSLVAPALAELAPVSGFWRHEDELYQAAIMPLAQGPSLVGYLLMAQRVDDELARDIARASDAEVAFWLPGDDPGEEGAALVASSLNQQQAEALVVAFRGTPALVDALKLGQAHDRLALDVGGERWLLRLTPIAGVEDPELGTVSALASATAAGRGFEQILNLVLLAGLASLALALVLSFWLSRRILRPVARLADTAERAAAGDYHARTAVAGSDALARLARAFDSLLSNLREKRDIESYVANFSRFVPDVQEAVPAPLPPPAATVAYPARRSDAVLLAIEVPSTTHEEAAPALADAVALGKQLHELASLCGGCVASGDGERWVLSFEGEERLEHTLQAARIALSELGTEAARPTLSMAEGQVTCGGLPSEHGQLAAVLGTAGRQVLRLLCESAPGQALIARPVGERIRERFGTEALEVASGTLAARKYYALRLQGLQTLAQPESEGAPVGAGATQVLPVASSAYVGGELQPGSRFGGRYEILATLGAGGMGIVYKARDVELADVVALKMLRPGALMDREQMDRLKDEIRLARRITHPNVLRTFDFGEVDGRPYISMEYVRGVTLRSLLDQSGQLPYSAGLRIARQLCAGLGAAHDVGVLHRDIKPENLILEAGGNARLMDFGIARPARRSQPGLTQPGMFVGTPHYSAPEQLAGEEVDERADIYACGAVMSEMFCGGLPYEGATTMEIYLAQVQQEPQRPSSFWPEVPPVLERIILRCIARRRDDRFQSAAELGDALAELRA